MKKILFALMLLINTNNAWSITTDELLKISDDTDKFFQYCIQEDKNSPDYQFTYCVGLYTGLAQGWGIYYEKSDECGSPSYADFKTKFNSLFYRNKLNTNLPTTVNVYYTLTLLCNEKTEQKKNLEN